MGTYRNGFVPLSAVPVVIATGVSDLDGYWEQRLSPSTARKWAALVALGRKRTGRTLQLTVGFSCYRPYAAQVKARAVWGNGAAVPGTSSHGGFWEGRDTLAMDIGNWFYVYQNHGGMDQFFADCRAVGLTPGMIMRSRGYPDEPWHVIDLAPWAAVPADSGGSKPLPKPEPEEEEEEDDMAKRSGWYYTRARDKATVMLLTCPEAGWWMEYLDGTVIGGNGPIAATFETGNYVTTTEAFANALKASIDRTRDVSVSGKLAVAEPEPATK